jgi:RNA polymerase sigma-70 factor (ECF subfamily)|tara:strand:- start:14705 stop:15313 length:609 start_codon:yes stop_codon:yes gene_type:complete
MSLAIGQTLANISYSSRRSYGRKGDDELMTAYQSGDMRAFDELYRRFKQPLYSFLIRQSGGEPVARELFQDVWLRVISSGKRYSSSGRFRSWLFTLAHNRLVDYYRQQDRIPEGEALTDVAAPTSDSPEQDAILMERAERLLTIVESLPSEQKEAFLLREEGGLTIEEIAGTQNIAREAAKSRLRYAYGKIRTKLAETENET